MWGINKWNMNMLVLVWFCLTNHCSGPFYQSTFGDNQQPSPESLLSLFLDSAAAVDDGQVKSKNKGEEKPFFPTAFMAYLPTHTKTRLFRHYSLDQMWHSSADASVQLDFDLFDLFSSFPQLASESRREVTTKLCFSDVMKVQHNECWLHCFAKAKKLLLSSSTQFRIRTLAYSDKKFS